MFFNFGGEHYERSLQTYKDSEKIFSYQFCAYYADSSGGSVSDKGQNSLSEVSAGFSVKPNPVQMRSGFTDF